LRATNLLAPPSGVKLTERAGTLAASGMAPSLWMARFNERGALIPGVASLDTTQLQNGDIVALESVLLTFPVGQAKLEPGQASIISRAAVDLKTLRHYAELTNQTAALSIIGHTDSSGIEGANQVLSSQRAATVAALLMSNGIPRELLVSRGVGTAQPLRNEDNEQARHLNRSVTFHVALSPSAP